MIFWNGALALSDSREEEGGFPCRPNQNTNLNFAMRHEILLCGMIICGKTSFAVF